MFVPKNLGICEDRTIAQAVSRWLLTTAVQVRARVKSCGICGRQSETGAGVPLELRFPLPIIPPTAPSSSSSPGSGTIGQIAVDIASGFILTRNQGKTKLRIYNYLAWRRSLLSQIELKQSVSPHGNYWETRQILAISRIMFIILPHLIDSRREKYRWTLVFNSHVTLTNCLWDWQRRKSIWSSWYSLNESSEPENKVLIRICRCEVRAG
jgi:hypothetical protein